MKICAHMNSGHCRKTTKIEMAKTAMPKVLLFLEEGWVLLIKKKR